MEKKMGGRLLVMASAGILAASQLAFAQQASSVQFLNSGKVNATNLPFSEAVRVGNVIYLSGQIGIIPGTRNLAAGGIKEEARQTLENIKTSLEANGYALNEVVKCTVMLTDMSEWGTFNEVYKTFFSGRYPARSAFGVNGLVLGAKVEVECVAAK
jgi:reactive intermediate/imine deaminase